MNRKTLFVKLAILVLPLLLITAWFFGVEGARLGYGLEVVYWAMFIQLWLALFVVVMVVQGYYLARQGKKAKGNKWFIITALVLLVAAALYWGSMLH